VTSFNLSRARCGGKVSRVSFVAGGGPNVPRFLIDRNFSKITEDELAGFARDSKRIARNGSTT